MESLSEQLFHCPPPQPSPTSMTMDRRWRENIDPTPNCPRCASTNTKFCYYNNYSLSQPRFFCKGCKRYWTRGGSLRNVPVGGGCRKTRRSRSSRSSKTVTGLAISSKSSSDCSQESRPDIDMAAVFAKFLNHDQAIVSQEINETTNTTSSDGSHDSMTSSSCGMESQVFFDDILDQDSQVMESLGPGHKTHNPVQEGLIQGFINPDFASFNDLIEDVFWTDDLDTSNVTWQPVAQPHEFDSTDLSSTDNWSYFDNPGFEIFSRP